MAELFLRRTAGLLLIAVGAALSTVVAARLGAAQKVLVYGAIAFWVMTVLGLWWHRRRVPMWRVWARWAAFPGIACALFQGLRMDVEHNRPVSLLVAAGLVAVCWALSEAVALVTTRPITPALIRSKLEIPFPARGLEARLCVREHRLVLDSLDSRRKRSRDVVAVPWTALRSIELVEVREEMTCTVFLHSATKRARARTFDVPPGPALHVIGTARELLIPVTEQIGRTVVAAVEARSAGVEVEEKPLTTEDWCNRADVPFTPEEDPARQLRRGELIYKYSTDKRPYHLVLVGTICLLPLYALTMITLSIVTGSAELQQVWNTAGGLDAEDRLTIAGTGLVAVAFFWAAYAFVFRGFQEFMETQDYVEAFPEPPPPPPKTGTVPGSGKKRKKR
ncbi:hypothetical protein [Lentzea californiensis]|uniref:hypothetical protein n=1 Tax=Lentzea californiensis TaxID=438851 RepID=UPI002164E36B|nr:hypothetical protein [Lentzea californiensis]MCR3747515.1 hypothetical protein [Lentzea californiensis]